MKCQRCGKEAFVKLKAYNAAFCPGCFDLVFKRQVQKGIKDESMFGYQDRVLVAVSGGKDSLTLWQVLWELGYQTTGVHLKLNFGDFSEEELRKTREFAQKRGLELLVVDLEAEVGVPVSLVAKANRRHICSVCGSLKRYLLNKAAVEGGFSVLATGHGLDDEAARLLGNLLYWQERYLDKMYPSLPSTHPKLAKRVKPLFRVGTEEILTYASLKEIDYVKLKCPFSSRATSWAYKEFLEKLEGQLPGVRRNFYLGFLERERKPVEDVGGECEVCGYPSYSSPCNFCRLVGRAKALE